MVEEFVSQHKRLSVEFTQQLKQTIELNFIPFNSNPNRKPKPTQSIESIQKPIEPQSQQVEIKEENEVENKIESQSTDDKVISESQSNTEIIEELSSDSTIKQEQQEQESNSLLTTQ